MSKKILIVDDDPSFVDAVAALLDENGYNTASADNGEKGAAKAKEVKPDLILLDVMMTTRGEGFDISRDLNKDPITKNIPVPYNFTPVRSVKILLTIFPHPNKHLHPSLLPRLSTKMLQLLHRVDF